VKGKDLKMSLLLDITRKRTSPVVQPARRKITISQKRWLLSAHLFFMAAWLGGSLCSLALNLIALTATDPHLINASYVFAEPIDNIIIRSGAAGSLITGILLAWLTQWGLITFYWIIAKEFATITLVLTDQIIIRWNQSAIALTATPGLGALSNSPYLSLRTLLFIGLSLRLILLLGIVVISIFKPWGARKQATQRPTAE
jgi:hypothetical protein